MGYFTTCTRDGAVGWGTALQAGRSQVRIPIVAALIVSQERVPRIFPWSKGGRCVGMTSLPPSWADCLEIWDPRPPGTLSACTGIGSTFFYFTTARFRCWHQFTKYIRIYGVVYLAHIVGQFRLHFLSQRSWLTQRASYNRTVARRLVQSAVFNS